MASASSPSDTPHLPSHQALIVRSLPNTTEDEREKILEDVEYNIFAFPAGLVTCDYLSDSGTSAMTDLQWSACKRSFKIHYKPFKTKIKQIPASGPPEVWCRTVCPL